MPKQSKQSSGSRKHGRSKRKTEGRKSPISRYIRGLIGAYEYFKLSKQKIR